MTLTQKWVFTANNPCDDWEVKAKALKDKKDKPAISFAYIGREVAPTTNTPHLQGYFEFSLRKRLPGAKKILKACGLAGAHLEPARGSVDQIKAYNGKTDESPVEWGEAMVGQGSRKDLKMLQEAAEAGASFLQLSREFPGAHARFSGWTSRVREEARAERELKRRKEENQKVVLRPWQEEVWTAVENQTRRKITWCWEETGNVGKTVLADWMASTKDAFCCVGGKYADIALAYDCQEYVVFDLSREQHERVPYALLEGFKNGRIFSGKYASKNKLFKPAKVLIFANFEPDLEKMSSDRWDIHHIASL